MALENAEIAAVIASKEIRSYKDLPKRLFQIQKQFFEGPRTRAALIDDREFLALETFGFDLDENSSMATYRSMQAAVDSVCNTAGLAGRWVEADVDLEGLGF